MSEEKSLEIPSENPDAGKAMSDIMDSYCAGCNNPLWKCICPGIRAKKDYDDAIIEYMEKALDTQVGGDHYKKKKIQPVEYIIANNLDFCDGSIIKYITRHKDKGGAEDIKKIIHYCNIILENQYNEKE